jgi:hypothetical protein
VNKCNRFEQLLQKTVFTEPEMKEIQGLFHAINVNQWSSRELLLKICRGKCNGKIDNALL